MIYTKYNIKDAGNFVSILPPTIIETDKRWAIFTGPNGTWLEIDHSVTYNQLLDMWKKPELSIMVPPNAKAKGTAKKEWKIPASKGDKYYSVVLKENSWSCTCPAFGFRKKCKHIEEAKTFI